MENAKPTGCYKCGRPGHWSRDCPSSSSSKPNADVVDGKSSSLSSNPNNNNNNNNNNPSIDSNNNNNNKSLTKKKIKPKLTPELLVSDNGLGYVLRHFPRNFNYHGPGHEELDHHHSHRDSSPINHDLFQEEEEEEEDLLHEFFDKEQSTAVSDGPSGPGDIGEAEITQEQRSRMEANRLKALERAKARSQSKPAS
ncbi:hypothetical protein ACFE04_005535 [Oxalis oulophora]